ncbi:MAG: biopolymer transporter ExbD [Myxococcota bacterium]
MPIHKPGRVLLHHIPLKFVSMRVAGGGRKGVDTSIILVPFIDFLIVLVVFLLSTSGQQVVNQTQSDSLELPDGANVDTLEEAPIITIGRREVALDGRRMADTNSLAQTAELNRIDQLVQDLETLKRNWNILHPRQPFPGTVIIMADQGVDYRVVKKVMFSAAQAGYANISFAVNKTGG